MLGQFFKAKPVSMEGIYSGKINNSILTENISKTDTKKYIKLKSS